MSSQSSQTPKTMVEEQVKEYFDEHYVEDMVERVCMELNMDDFMDSEYEGSADDAEEACNSLDLKECISKGVLAALHEHHSNPQDGPARSPLYEHIFFTIRDQLGEVFDKDAIEEEIPDVNDDAIIVASQSIVDALYPAVNTCIEEGLETL